MLHRAKIGDISTRWQGMEAASAGVPTYITIDLEKLCAVDSFDISFFSPSSRAHYYEISVSTDGESFTQVVDNLRNSRYNVTTFSHTLTQSVVARYVRLGITGQTAGATPGVYEFTVYGEPAENGVEALTFDKEYLYLGVGDVEALAYRVEPAAMPIRSIKRISTTFLHRRMLCRRREKRINEKVLHTRMGFSSVFVCRNDSPFR